MVIPFQDQHQLNCHIQSYNPSIFHFADSPGVLSLDSENGTCIYNLKNRRNLYCFNAIIVKTLVITSVTPAQMLILNRSCTLTSSSQPVIQQYTTPQPNKGCYFEEWSLSPFLSLNCPKLYHLLSHKLAICILVCRLCRSSHLVS